MCWLPSLTTASEGNEVSYRHTFWGAKFEVLILVVCSFSGFSEVLTIARWNFKLTGNRTDDALPANAATPKMLRADNATFLLFESDISWIFGIFLRYIGAKEQTYPLKSNIFGQMKRLVFFWRNFIKSDSSFFLWEFGVKSFIGEAFYKAGHFKIWPYIVSLSEWLLPPFSPKLTTTIYPLFVSAFTA